MRQKLVIESNSINKVISLPANLNLLKKKDAPLSCWNYKDKNSFSKSEWKSI